MISRELLEGAVDRKIIQRDQVEPLLDFIRHRQSGSEESAEPNSYEEPLRFVRGFGDIFISLGILLLVIAINMLSLSGYLYFLPVAGFVVLAEWLVRVRRLSLPGIGILLAILFFVNKAIDFDHENATVIGLAILSLASLVFYLRYKMPFSLLPVAAGAVAIVVVQIGTDLVEYPLIFSGLGLIVFVVAMAFDIRDTERNSHLSDSAFWLHLLAAPLIIHGLMITVLLSQQQWLADMGHAVFIVLFFTGILLIALLLDRRAMLVATQLYMVYAVTQFLEGQLGSTQNIIIYVLLVLGFAIIFFGTYWYKTRRLLYGFLTGTAISRLVPAFEQADHQR